ncbi:hypothetical protein CTAYLR_004134 [Chrysophaeum taylorii]|uniref:Uncharacterized protein n=1 Tax=Chrysophaeum taylorii TaxID=2483200 RepID=A0AAD7UMN4_9STRA|nr:hypothetical protein CTAYLR_004134 [Chrysophaeum taylorii]
MTAVEVVSEKKRKLESGEESRPSKKKAGDDAKRRAVRAAMAQYARIGESALKAVQRAKVVLKRVEEQVEATATAISRLPERAPRESRFESRLAPEVLAGILATAAARPAVAAAKPERKPTREELSLRVDEKGREVDAQGNVIERKVDEQKVEQKKENPYLAHYYEDGGPIDARLTTRKRETKKDRAFAFVKEGHFVKIAEATRAKLQGPKVDEIEEEVAPEPKRLIDSLPRRPEHVASVPGMEWWDEEFLPKEVRTKRLSSVAERVKDQYELCSVENSRFFGLVHHPPTAKPLGLEKKQPETIPFYLTRQDRKRVRRQTRAEREREKQDKIQLGLIPPPEPKFKLSNFMKVLGEQAVANPSKMEQKVMEQVNQRLQHHEMRNAARKLTPQERKEKKRRKLAEDTSHEVRVAVFYVSNLDSAQHRFKLDVNANQLNLTGTVLLCTSPEASFATVVVEGGPKGVRRFVALVTRRIPWADDGDDDDDDDAAALGGGVDASVGATAATTTTTTTIRATARKKKWAALVWSGTVVKRAFTQFKFQECKVASTARRVLETKSVAHYWDMALQHHDEGPPPKGDDDL